MSFKPKNLAEWKLRSFPTKASTLITNQSVVVQSTSDSGQLISGTTTTDLIAGLAQKTKAASDATTDSIPVLVPTAFMATVLATVSSGTATPGETCDLASDLGIAADATTEDVFTVTRSLSSTLCEGYFNNPAPTRA